MSTPETVTDPWAGVLGQDEAVARLRASVERPVHAYLFVGPAGSGKLAALRVFAGELFAAGAADPDEADRHRRLAQAERHPDLVVVKPEGAVFRGGTDDDSDSDAARVIREAYRSPVEASCKVVAALDFHTANDRAVGALLKTIEEPPSKTVVVVVSEDVPPEQATIASRCMRVDFRSVPDETLVDALVAEGVPSERAREVVVLAGGDMARARVLATDERLHLRVTAWRDVPFRLDGTGSAASTAAAELRAMIDDALAPVVAAHERELESFDAEAERYGLRATGGRRAELVKRHRRIERKFRGDELRLGFANLARAYRDEAATSSRPGPILDSAAAIHEATEALLVNPNEELLLVGLLLRLAPLRR